MFDKITLDIHVDPEEVHIRQIIQDFYGLSPNTYLFDENSCQVSMIVPANKPSRCTTVSDCKMYDPVTIKCLDGLCLCNYGYIQEDICTCPDSRTIRMSSFYNGYVCLAKNECTDDDHCYRRRCIRNETMIGSCV